LMTIIILLALASDITAQGKKIRKVKAESVRVHEDPNDVLAAKQLLSDLGYWVGPVNSEPDNYLKHSLVAFQKVEGRQRTGRITPEELQALRTAKRPEPREKGCAHIEIDLQRQVLFMVDENGAVSNILPVSTGSGKMFTEGGRTRRAVTPIGTFVISRKIKAMHKSPLGLLYYPNYLVEGIAIHGNPSVPAFPASHGCIRIPMYASVEFTGLAPVGIPVVIHSGTE
jgi:Uncharacterized protein conserved in bacteria